MATRRSHTYTSRANGGVTKEQRARRLRTLKELSRPLTSEELEELQQLMRSALDAKD